MSIPREVLALVVFGEDPACRPPFRREETTLLARFLGRHYRKAVPVSRCSAAGQRPHPWKPGIRSQHNTQTSHPAETRAKNGFTGQAGTQRRPMVGTD